MEGYSWPYPLEEAPYPKKTQRLSNELVHAVGAIVIGWNYCEAEHLELTREVCGLGLTSDFNGRISSRIIKPMSNRQRSDLLRGALSEVDLPPEANASIDAFQSHFDICLQNRNLIVHSNYVEEFGRVEIYSSKSHPNIQYRYLPDDAEFWETTISEFKRLYAFGADLTNEPFDQRIARQAQWPDIPPKPRDLNQMFPPDVIVPYWQRPDEQD